MTDCIKNSSFDANGRRGNNRPSSGELVEGLRPQSSVLRVWKPQFKLSLLNLPPTSTKQPSREQQQRTGEGRKQQTCLVRDKQPVLPCIQLETVQHKRRKPLPKHLHREPQHRTDRQKRPHFRPPQNRGLRKHRLQASVPGTILRRQGGRERAFRTPSVRVGGWKSWEKIGGERGVAEEEERGEAAGQALPAIPAGGSAFYDTVVSREYTTLYFGERVRGNQSFSLTRLVWGEVS